MIIDFRALSSTRAYQLMTQTVVPRPIAWVLTENDTGEGPERYNLAPFSYFNAVASNPPTLMISIGSKVGGGQKDTLRNIQRSGKLVIHIAGETELEALNQSAATLPYGVSELATNSLTTCAMEGFTLPRLNKSKLAFACTLDHTHLIGQSNQTLVFAHIQSVYIADEISRVEEDSGPYSIDISTLAPLARLGGNSYAKLGSLINLKRPV